MLLLRGIARPLTSIHIQNLMSYFGCKQIDHLPYSPELAQSGYHWFHYIKEFLLCQTVPTDFDVKKKLLEDWLSSQAANFFDLGIQNLVERYDLCRKTSG